MAGATSAGTLGINITYPAPGHVFHPNTSHEVKFNSQHGLGPNVFAMVGYGVIWWPQGGAELVSGNDYKANVYFGSGTGNATIAIVSASDMGITLRQYFIDVWQKFETLKAKLKQHPHQHCCFHESDFSIPGITMNPIPPGFTIEASVPVNIQ